LLGEYLAATFLSARITAFMLHESEIMTFFSFHPVHQLKKTSERVQNPGKKSVSLPSVFSGYRCSFSIAFSTGMCDVSPVFRLLVYRDSNVNACI